MLGTTESKNACNENEVAETRAITFELVCFLRAI